MKKALYRIASVIVVAILFLTTSNIEVLATVSTGNVFASEYKTPKKQRKYH